jgi:hypothetical protein
VTKGNQLLAQPGDDAFGSTIKLRRNALVERRGLGECPFPARETKTLKPTEVALHFEVGLVRFEPIDRCRLALIPGVRDVLTATRNELMKADKGTGFRVQGTAAAAGRSLARPSGFSG